MSKTAGIVLCYVEDFAIEEQSKMIRRRDAQTKNPGSLRCRGYKPEPIEPAKN
jgi:hypothetical protein